MGKASLGKRPNERPAGEAKPNVCAISDGEAGAYCTVRLVLTYAPLDKLYKSGFLYDGVTHDPLDMTMTQTLHKLMIL